MMDWVAFSKHFTVRQYEVVVEVTKLFGGRVRALVARHALCMNNSGNPENAEVSKTMSYGLKRLQATMNV